MNENNNYNGAAGIVGFFVAILLMAAFAFFQDVYHDNTEIGKLENKLTEVKNLKQKINQKQIEATKQIEDFYEQIKVIKSEIQIIKLDNNIDSYYLASINKGITYRLSNIAKMQIYSSELTKLKKQLIQGDDELLYIERELESRLGVVKIINPEEIEEIVTKINPTLEKYLQYTNELVIEDKNLPLPSLEKIWKEIQ